MALQSKPTNKATGTLVSKVAKILRSSILNGEFSQGEKLPSEAKLTAAHGVSRTVIREAIAALRSDGLVEARQGAGVFVLKSQRHRNTEQNLDKATLFSILELLEFCAPIEVDAAGLAAVRRSPAQEEGIFDSHADFLNCIEQNQPTSHADYALHIAIAEATNNPLFFNFIEKYGENVFSQFEATASNTLLKQIYQEHELIVSAISNGDAAEARATMKAHLDASQRRYRDMLRHKRQQN